MRRRRAAALAWLGCIALAGCMGPHHAASGPRPRVANVAGCWPALNDRPLSALIGHAVAPVPGAAADALATAIAHRYVELRARQATLVLLAEREELDMRSPSGVRPGPTGNAAGRADLLRTRGDQARTRAGIAALRERLAVLTGLAPGLIDILRGGAIPLPPAGSAACAPAGAAALAHYAAAQIAAARAQAQAERARMAAAASAGPAPPAEPAPGAAGTADRRALEALLAEQQARAAMVQAYVALPGAIPRPDRPAR